MTQSVRFDIVTKESVPVRAYPYITMLISLKLIAFLVNQQQERGGHQIQLYWY